MPKKTVSVVKMVDEANRMLALDTLSDTVKQGICVMIEHVLNSADAYNGFNDVYWVTTGHQQWIADGKPNPQRIDDKYFYGPTGHRWARRYYVHPKAC